MKAAAIHGAVKNFAPISYGLRNTGVDAQIFFSVEQALDWGCDFFIQTNIYNQWKNHKETYLEIKNTGKPILVIESPVFRFIDDQVYKWYRLSWNSYLFPEAVYPWEDNSDRWQWISDEYNLKLLPWKTDGHLITIALQKFSDSSLNSLYAETDNKPFPVYQKWLSNVVNSLKEIGHKQIVLRPHPLNNETQVKKIINAFSKCTVTRDNEHWFKSKRVLTFNSLFALDSLYNGIPTLSLSNTSLQSQFLNLDIGGINDDGVLFDRQTMFSKLSYCQWREDEIRQGVPFKKLLSLMP
jgi:hypothetical protein